MLVGRLWVYLWFIYLRKRVDMIICCICWMVFVVVIVVGIFVFGVCGSFLGGFGLFGKVVL